MKRYAMVAALGVGAACGGSPGWLAAAEGPSLGPAFGTPLVRFVAEYQDAEPAPEPGVRRRRPAPAAEPMLELPAPLPAPPDLPPAAPTDELGLPADDHASVGQGYAPHTVFSGYSGYSGHGSCAHGRSWLGGCCERDHYRAEKWWAGYCDEQRHRGHHGKFASVFACQSCPPAPAATSCRPHWLGGLFGCHSCPTVDTPACTACEPAPSEPVACDGCDGCSRPKHHLFGWLHGLKHRAACAPACETDCSEPVACEVKCPKSCGWKGRLHGWLHRAKHACGWGSSCDGCDDCGGEAVGYPPAGEGYEWGDPSGLPVLPRPGPEVPPPAPIEEKSAGWLIPPPVSWLPAGVRN